MKKLHMPRPTVLIAAALAMITLIACNPNFPEDSPLPKGITGEDLVHDYRFNQHKAKEKFNDQWYLVSAGPVTHITDGDRVNFTYPNGKMHMKFRNKDEAAEIKPRQRIIALCKIQGTNTHYMFRGGLYLNGCQWPKEASRPTRSPND